MLNDLYYGIILIWPCELDEGFWARLHAASTSPALELALHEKQPTPAGSAAKPMRRACLLWVPYAVCAPDQAPVLHAAWCWAQFMLCMRHAGLGWVYVAHDSCEKCRPNWSKNMTRIVLWNTIIVASCGLFCIACPVPPSHVALGS